MKHSQHSHHNLVIDCISTACHLVTANSLSIKDVSKLAGVGLEKRVTGFITCSSFIAKSSFQLGRKKWKARVVSSMRGAVKFLEEFQHTTKHKESASRN